MGFWRVLYRCGRTIGHLTVGEFTVTGVLLLMFAFLVSSWEMNGKAERRWLGTSLCDNERTIALRKNALRAYDGKSPDLIPPGPRSRVSTYSCANGPHFTVSSPLLKNTTISYPIYPFDQYLWELLSAVSSRVLCCLCTTSKSKKNTTENRSIFGWEKNKNQNFEM